jgi:hypothetical protein
MRILDNIESDHRPIMMKISTNTKEGKKPTHDIYLTTEKH